MAKTKIEWCHYTFNPWIGCSRVSPGCEHCYAEAQVRRAPNLILGKGPHPLLGHNKRMWGVMSPRRVTSDAYWDQPLRWNRAAAKSGERRRVFCASMADVFEDWRGEPTGLSDWPIPESLHEVRNLLWELILDTSHLDWLLLTKRPENVLQMVPAVWISDPPLEVLRTDRWPRNVWIGCTVEDQKRAEDRLDHLVQIPAPVLFVSYEPALEQVDFGPWLDRIQWLIVGGESGPGARPFDVAWMRKTISQCHTAKVPVFCKQLGANVRDRNDAGFDGQPGDAWDFGETDPCDMVEDSPNGFREEYQGAPVRIRLRDRKGGDMDEWPEELRVREFPEVGR